MYASDYGVPQKRNRYILVGNFESLSDTGTNIQLMRTDPDGNEEWTQSFGTIFRKETGNSVRLTQTNGYIIGGTSLPENNEKGYCPLSV